MATKKGAGGKQQPYDKKTGRYGNGDAAKREELRRIYDSVPEIDRAAKKVKVSLTKKEFAVFYQKLGEIKRGGYVDRNEKGEMYIPLEEQDEKGDIHHKIVLNGGNYVNPKIKRVFEFENGTAMQDFLLELER